MKKIFNQRSIAIYLIISSIISVAYLLIYIYILTPMPFIKNSSILDTGFTAARLCFDIAIMILLFIIPINAILAVSYIVFKITKNLSRK